MLRLALGRGKIIKDIVSAKTGKGFDAWIDWLRREANAYQNGLA